MCVWGGGGGLGVGELQVESEAGRQSVTVL